MVTIPITLIKLPNKYNNNDIQIWTFTSYMHYKYRFFFHYAIRYYLIYVYFYVQLLQYFSSLFSFQHLCLLWRIASLEQTCAIDTWMQRKDASKRRYKKKHALGNNKIFPRMNLTSSSKLLSEIRSHSCVWYFSRVRYTRRFINTRSHPERINLIGCFREICIIE